MGRRKEPENQEKDCNLTSVHSHEHKQELQILARGLHKNQSVSSQAWMKMELRGTLGAKMLLIDKIEEAGKP